MSLSHQGSPWLQFQVTREERAVAKRSHLGTGQLICPVDRSTSQVLLGGALFITDAARNPQLVGRLGDFH